MANFEIPENPEYIEQIRRFETTDKAHADLFNAAFQVLINNETFLKKVLEKQGIDIQEQYEQSTGYTDTKIGQLINGAPETLDTIKEVADAILENETVIEALNEAVGKKLNKDGDLTDTTVIFTSEDEEEATGWKNIGKIVSGKLKDILHQVSIMSNNLKYLGKLLGTTNISGIADGTLTGAVSALNTGLQEVNDLKCIDFGEYDYTSMTTDDIVKDIFNKAPLNPQVTIIGRFWGMNAYRIIIQCYQRREFASAIVFSYGSKGIIFYAKENGIVVKYTTTWAGTIV